MADVTGICDGDDPVSAVKVQPSQVTVRSGVSVQIAASLLGGDGAPMWMCVPPTTWTSRDPSIATVSAGLVVGVRAGTTFVRAQAGGRSDSARVTVTSSQLASVTIEPTSLSLLVGQTARMRVIARDTDGNPTITGSIAWASDNATIATISNTGMLVAVEPGTVTVRATVEGLEAFAQVPITRDPPSVRFQAIAAGGGTHSCGIVGGGAIPDGTTYCWGSGMFGQLGNGVAGNRDVPTRVLAVPPLVSLAVNGVSSCGVSASGEVYCWGYNGSGQLGDGTTLDRLTPVRVATVRTFRAVVLAGAFACALDAAGSAYCWGRMGSTAITTPSLLPGGIQFTELTGGSGFVCGRATDGRAYCWGERAGWVTGPTPTVVATDIAFSQISAGAAHVCGVVASDGTGMCWGQIDSQLGPGVTQGSYSRPIRVPGELRFTTIATGAGFTCGITSAAAYCLGITQLSNAAGSNPLPRLIPKEDQHPFVSISGGGAHACAIDRSGGGWCWGENWIGQVGAGEYGSNIAEPLQLRVQ